jgi:hypothetical protein
MWNLFLAFFNYHGVLSEGRKLWRHANGALSAGEKSYVPASERQTCYTKARLWLGIYVAVCCGSLYHRSPLPVMFCFLPCVHTARTQSCYVAVC